jgi:hypothetical protein
MDGIVWLVGIWGWWCGGVLGMVCLKLLFWIFLIDGDEDGDGLMI